MNHAHRFAVIGLGRFGMRLARALAAAGAEVVAVDKNPTLIEQIRDDVTLAVVLDTTDQEALIAQGIDKVDVAVVGVGGAFEACALATSVLKQLGVPRVLSRATTRARAEILSRIGADDIINPEAEAAQRWCSRLTMPQVMEKIDLGEAHSLVQIQTPGSWAGKSLEQLNIRKKHKVNVVAIRRLKPGKDKSAGRYVIDTPLPESQLEADDLLLVVGSNEAIEQLPKS